MTALADPTTTNTQEIIMGATAGPYASPGATSGPYAVSGIRARAWQLVFPETEAEPEKFRTESAAYAAVRRYLADYRSSGLAPSKVYVYVDEHDSADWQLYERVDLADLR